MSDNVKMILRYVFAMVMTTASNKGWLHVSDVNGFTNIVVDWVSQTIAFAPVAYAYFKVTNVPVANLSPSVAAAVDAAKS